LLLVRSVRWVVVTRNFSDFLQHQDEVQIISILNQRIFENYFDFWFYKWKLATLIKSKRRKFDVKEKLTFGRNWNSVWLSKSNFGSVLGSGDKMSHPKRFERNKFLGIEIICGVKQDSKNWDPWPREIIWLEIKVINQVKQSSIIVVPAKSQISRFRQSAQKGTKVKLFTAKTFLLTWNEFWKISVQAPRINGIVLQQVKVRERKNFVKFTSYTLLQM